MKAVIIFLSVLILTLPNKANACDPFCFDEDEEALLGLVILGVPAILTSSILFSSIGLAIDSRENRPYYWRVVGFSALASSVGVGIAYFRYDGHEENFEGFIGYPLLFGAVGTVLTHVLLPRRTGKTSSALWQYAPKVSVSPVDHGGSIRLNWSF